MALQSTQPENKSFLSPTGFRFQVQKLPHVNYFCTNAQIPDLTMGQIDTLTNTFSKLPIPGDKLSFSPLNLRFRIDEDLKNYREIYDWMIGLGYPDNFGQRAVIERQSASVGEVYSDATLIVTTASYNPNIEVKFVDLYPISLSSVEFDIEKTDVEYAQADVQFAYRKFELTSIE